MQTDDILIQKDHLVPKIQVVFYMKKGDYRVIKSTKYCILEKQARVQNGDDVAAVEDIFVRHLNRNEIRFAFYKTDGITGKDRFVPRPLDLTEEELLSLFKESVQKDIFTKHFKDELTRIMSE